MSIRNRLGEIRRRALLSFFCRPVRLGDLGPVVTFTFDDFPRSAYLGGAATLEKYGACGTYYVAPGLMNTSNEVGELFHQEDLEALLEKGNELGTQTLRHSSCRTVSLREFRADVTDGLKTIEKLAGHNSTNFAYPYGHVTLRAKKTIGPTLSSSRSIIPGLNGPDVDLNLLRANRLYGGMEEAKYVEDLIAENAKQRAWLIFYTHDVRPDPSEWGCIPELFEFAVRAAAKSSRIMTVGQVLSEISPQ